MQQSAQFLAPIAEQASKQAIPPHSENAKKGEGQAGRQRWKPTYNEKNLFFLIPDSLNMRTGCLMQSECEQSNTRIFFPFSSIWAIIELQKVDHFVSQRSVGFPPPLRPILCYTRPPTHKREEEGLLHFMASKVEAAAVKMRDSSPLLPLFSPPPPAPVIQPTTVSPHSRRLSMEFEQGVNLFFWGGATPRRHRPEPQRRRFFCEEKGEIPFFPLVETRKGQKSKIAHREREIFVGKPPPPPVLVTTLRPPFCILLR